MRRPPVLNIHKMLAQGLPSHTNGRGRWPGATWIPLPGRLIPREKTGQMTDCHLACEVSGSPGRVRTCDTLINSQLRYHCATGEFSTREVIIRITPRDATLKLNFFSFLARALPGLRPSAAADPRPSLAAVGRDMYHGARRANRVRPARARRTARLGAVRPCTHGDCHAYCACLELLKHRP